MDKFLGENAQVRAKKQGIVIQWQHIDEVTTKKDIRDTLQRKLGPLGLQKSTIEGLSKAYRGSRTATNSLVSWVLCQLKEQVSFERSFRWLEFGHITKKFTKYLSECN